jgi:hypothetical protein
MEALSTEKELGARLRREGLGIRDQGSGTPRSSVLAFPNPYPLTPNPFVILCVLLAGCSGLDAPKSPLALLRPANEPRELVLLCRPQVLKLDDGSRSPGVVARSF